MTFLCFFSHLLFTVVHSSRVSHYGFHKNQRARLVVYSYLLSQAHSAWFFVCLVVGHLVLHFSLYRAPVLPVGGCMVDRIRNVPASQHLHVSPAQETAASLSSWYPVLWRRFWWNGPEGGWRRRGWWKRLAHCPLIYLVYEHFPLIQNTLRKLNVNLYI